MRSEFGELMYQSREVKELTLRNLAKLVELSPSLLSEIENGRKMPPKDETTIKKIARVLGGDPTKFLEAARKERAKKDTRFMEKFFDADPDLTWAMCRAVEDAPSEEVKKGLKSLLDTLNKRDGNR